MATQIDRRAFLKGAAPYPDPPAIRPPGAEPDDFETRCTSCGACSEVCPEAVILADAKGRPVLEFNSGSCTFCTACIDACPSGALSTENLDAWAWVAKPTPTCMSMNGISCRICEDSCLANAIRFRLQTGGRSQPVIDVATCTGCGACAVVCPSQSIEFVQFAPSAAGAVA